MNRYFRRMQRFGKSFSGRRSQSEMTDKSGELVADDRQQDDYSVRAKNSGKGKSPRTSGTSSAHLAFLRARACLLPKGSTGERS